MQHSAVATSANASSRAPGSITSWSRARDGSASGTATRPSSSRSPIGRQHWRDATAAFALAFTSSTACRAYVGRGAYHLAGLYADLPAQRGLEPHSPLGRRSDRRAATAPRPPLIWLRIRRQTPRSSGGRGDPCARAVASGPLPQGRGPCPTSDACLVTPMGAAERGHFLCYDTPQAHRSTRAWSGRGSSPIARHMAAHRLWLLSHRCGNRPCSAGDRAVLA